MTFARNLTGMQIFGDAWTWWEKATGKYEEGQTPKPGAVLVFQSQGKMKLGHVAVVSQIITDRYIQVTHANWSPVDGHRGRVEENVNVMDVSDRGDWSKVKVWYGPMNDLGTTVYTTYGFIYQDTPQGQATRQMIAQSETKPAGPQPYQPSAAVQANTQLAMADAPADLPSDLKTALTPQGASADRQVRTVSAQITGAKAHRLIAKIDADADAAGSDDGHATKGHKVKADSKAKSSKAKATKSKTDKSKTAKAKSSKSSKATASKTKASKATASKAHGQKSAKKRH